MMDQTREFYAFERAARAMFEPPNPQDLELEVCTQFIVEAASRHSSVIVAFDVDGGSFGQQVGTCRGIDWGPPPRFLISLPPGRRRPWCALHEAAHAIVQEGGGHGPRFAFLCIELWATLGGWPREQLMELSERHGVMLWIEEMTGHSSEGERPVEAGLGGGSIPSVQITARDAEILASIVGDEAVSVTTMVDRIGVDRRGRRTMRDHLQRLVRAGFLTARPRTTTSGRGGRVLFSKVGRHAS